MPAEETPRQKKQASYPDSSAPTASYRVRSGRTSSLSFPWVCPVGRRPTESTRSTSGSRRHSRRTPCPIMPVAPNRTTRMARPAATRSAPPGPVPRDVLERRLLGLLEREAAVGEHDRDALDPREAIVLVPERDRHAPRVRDGTRERLRAGLGSLFDDSPAGVAHVRVLRPVTLRTIVRHQLLCPEKRACVGSRSRSSTCTSRAPAFSS